MSAIRLSLLPTTTRSTWLVETDDIFDAAEVGAERCVFIELKKANSYQNWASVVLGEGGGAEGASALRDARAAVAIDAVLRIGGSDQKQLTANQLAGYQQIARSPACERKDVYLRYVGEEKCYFLGKVAARPGLSAVGAAYAQAPLIIGHGRSMLPGVFPATPAEDEAFELLVGEADSELAVAQYQAGLTVVHGAAGAPVGGGSDWWEGAEPFTRPRAATDVGFEPEFLESDDALPFYAKAKADGSPVGEPIQANFESMLK